MESIVGTFHIDWKIIIAQAINFAVVFAVLYVFALKPLGKLMAERSEKIAKGVSDAKENAATLEKSRVEYEQMLARARAESDKLFAASKKEAEVKYAEMVTNAKEESASIIAAGKQTLEAEKIKTVNEAKKEIVSLATKAAEKLLGEGATVHFNEKVLKELGNL